MSDTTTATTLASDLTPALRFLLDHPELPAPRGVDVGHIGGDLSLIAHLVTADQVQAWADALGLQAASADHNGATQHWVSTFHPFYISAIAIVRDAS